jgi:hypothetical protein
LNTFDLWSGGCELNPTISVFFTNSSSSTSSSSAIATTWWIFFDLQYCWNVQKQDRSQQQNQTHKWTKARIKREKLQFL